MIDFYTVQFNHTLAAIMRGQWMLEKTWAEMHLPLVLNLLNGQPVNFIQRTGSEAIERPFLVDPKNMQRFNINAANVPAGCVAILPITGPITKYNGECGEPGMIQRSAWLAEMKARDNVAGVVLLIDTPGGEARATEDFSRNVKHFGKPVLSYVDGMAASAGVYFTSASDEVYLGSKSGQIGSIGSYVMLGDFSAYFEKMGVKIHEVYAPQSTDKNKPYKDALNGDYTAIQDDLKGHVDDFINHVKVNRPAAANKSDEWGTGKLFFAHDAIRLGLADGIKTFEQVVQKVAWLSRRKN